MAQLEDKQSIDYEFRKHPGTPIKESVVKHLEEHTKQFSHDASYTLNHSGEVEKRHNEILEEKKKRASSAVEHAKKVS